VKLQLNQTFTGAAPRSSIEKFKILTARNSRKFYTSAVGWSPELFTLQAGSCSAKYAEGH